MATPNISNLLKSGAIIYRAPWASTPEPLPDDTTVGVGADWSANWVRIGATAAPLTFVYEDERSDANVEEFLGPVDRRRVSEMARIETVLAEIDATYLQLLVGGTVVTTAAGASQTGLDELPVGNVSKLENCSIGFEGIGYDPTDESALPLRIWIPRATMTLNGELVFSRREESWVGMPIIIEAMVNSADGSLFTFQRITAIATA